MKVILTHKCAVIVLDKKCVCMNVCCVRECARVCACVSVRVYVSVCVLDEATGERLVIRLVCVHECMCARA